MESLLVFIMDTISCQALMARKCYQSISTDFGASGGDIIIWKIVMHTGLNNCMYRVQCAPYSTRLHNQYKSLCMARSRYCSYQSSLQYHRRFCHTYSLLLKQMGYLSQ